MTPAQEREAYEEKRNKLARELLPGIVLRFRDSALDFPALVRHTRGLAEEVLCQEGETSATERQITEALKYLRDPARSYENRVSCTISILTNKLYEEQNWREWQYNGATTITQYMVQKTTEPDWWLSPQSRDGGAVGMIWREFRHATHWDTHDLAQYHADRCGGRVVPVQISLPKGAKP